MKTLTIAVVALFTAFLPVPLAHLAQDPDAVPGRPGAPETIFYAVLEGLYDEGVATEDVDILLHQDPATRQYSYFVYGCPLCMPSIDALLLYRGRPKFYSQKGEPDTSAPGCPRRNGKRCAATTCPHGCACCTTSSSAA